MQNIYKNDVRIYKNEVKNLEYSLKGQCNSEKENWIAEFKQVNISNNDLE